MKKILLSLFLILELTGATIAKTTIYVSSSMGNNQNSGLTMQDPKKSIEAAMRFGDEICLKAGDVFYETLRLTKKVVTRYGEGGNPIISGYKRIIRPNWERVGDSIWRINLSTDNYSGYQTGSSALNNIGCIHDIESDEIHGRKVQYMDKLKEDWDIWQTEQCGADVAGNQFDYLYLCLSTNPNLLNLEFSVGTIAVTMNDATLDGVNIIGWGFGISANHKSIVRNARIDAIGGMIQLGASPFVCYGNGVEFYVANSMSDCIVENCYISRCYDCACTIQGSRHQGATPTNIVFRNNLIVGCCQGWEDFLNNGEEVYYQNCRFEKNIVCYSESGFGYPSTVVRYSHVLGNNHSGNRGMIIKDNIFVGGNLYRSSEYEGKYCSNIWVRNKFYSTPNSYLLCNYLGTKNYLKLPAEKYAIRQTEQSYRSLTGDKTTKIYYYSHQKAQKKANSAMKKYLRTHKY